MITHCDAPPGSGWIISTLAVAMIKHSSNARLPLASTSPRLAMTSSG